MTGTPLPLILMESECLVPGLTVKLTCPCGVLIEFSHPSTASINDILWSKTRLLSCLLKFESGISSTIT